MRHLSKSIRFGRRCKIIPRLLLLSSLAIAIVYAAAGEQAPYLATPQELHDTKVRELLPPHSALPPMLDLTIARVQKRLINDAWEKRLSGSMGVRPIEDIGVPTPDDVSSTSMTTTEYAGSLPLLPVESSQIVVKGKVAGGTCFLADNRRFVYSVFRLGIEEVFKGSRRQLEERGSIVLAAQLGGTVRFPSGRVTTYLEAGEGFLAAEKEYVIFLWAPARSSEVYVISEAYLIEGDQVFSINPRSRAVAHEPISREHFFTRLSTAIKEHRDGM